MSAFGEQQKSAESQHQPAVARLTVSKHSEINYKSNVCSDPIECHFLIGEEVFS
jgi:hypothetical protein